MSEAKSFFDYLSLALRYIIAGFICLAVIWYIDPCIEEFVPKPITNQYLVLILFIAGLTGILIYAIHYAFLDKVFYWITLLCYGFSRKYS